MNDQQTASAGDERPPYLIAAGVALGALVIYVATLAPTTQFWDTSEYIAAAYALGIPHPPGNPLFTIIAHTWGLLPIAARYAERINLLAATTSAIAAGCWFLIGERWIRAWVPARLQGLAQPDTIVVSEATRLQLGRMFELDDLGLIALKGFDKPARAWRVRRDTGGETTQVIPGTPERGEKTARTRRREPLLRKIVLHESRECVVAGAIRDLPPALEGAFDRAVARLLGEVILRFEMAVEASVCQPGFLHEIRYADPVEAARPCESTAPSALPSPS